MLECLELTAAQARLKAAYLHRRPAKCALYLRSVRVAKAAFRGLRCHPLTHIALKLRFMADSTHTPSAKIKDLTNVALRDMIDLR